MTISNNVSNELDIFVPPTTVGTLVETNVHDNDTNALIPSNPTRTMTTSSDLPQAAMVVHSTEVNENISPHAYTTYSHTGESSSSNDHTPHTDDDEIVTESLAARKHRKKCKKATGVSTAVVGIVLMGPILGVAAGFGAAHVVSKKMKKTNLKKERATSRARASQVRAHSNDFEPIKSQRMVV